MRPLTSATCLILLTGCGGETPVVMPEGETEMPVARTYDADPFFVDVTEDTGIEHVYRNGEEADHYTILESLGGGVAVIDYDRDGKPDIFAPGGGLFTGPEAKTISGLPGKMYRNLGGWKFRDVTDEVGLAKAPFYSHGTAVADYDRDGYPDLLVTGYGGVSLYRNVPAPGGRRFEDVTVSSGIAKSSVSWATSAAAADYDADGNVDFYVCQYVNWSWENHPECPGHVEGIKRDVCPPAKFQGLPGLLFRNRGDGTFEEVGERAGVGILGKGLGAVAADLDDDRLPELYVANDAMDNFLFVNRSRPGEVRFEEVGLSHGVARDGRGNVNGSMGIAVGDFAGSGRPSLWVTNYENEFHALYENVAVGEGGIRFRYATPRAGLGAIGPTYVGWGTAFLDAQLDGWPDIVISNGHVIRHPLKDNLAQPPVLFLNLERGGHRKFVASPGLAGPDFDRELRGRGLAVGDFDSDGRPDLVISCVNGPVRIMRNVAGVDGVGWAGIRLRPNNNRDVAGTRLSVRDGGRTVSRFVTGGGSYLSQSDPRILFGLGGGVRSAELEVRWASGSPLVEHFPLDLGEYQEIRQGGGR